MIIENAFSFGFFFAMGAAAVGAIVSVIGFIIALVFGAFER